MLQQVSRRAQAATQQICKAFPDSKSAEEMLAKLLQHKDNHIFRGLATLAAGGAPAICDVLSARLYSASEP